MSSATTGRWRPINIDTDAERLATMWNDSDDQWPGTLTDGVPMTAGTVRQRFEAEAPIEILVYDDGDAIGGYCSVWKDSEDPSAAWIALLNVAPAFQKRSLARQVLTHWVARAAELGFDRLDLGTWGGNLKAVPLYKKTGFFWKPGSWPHMMNFMPAILRAPPAKPFFDRHDWYATFQRELLQQADDERFEGMKVFTYRFVAGDEHLTVWADRQGNGLTAIDTDELSVAAIAEKIEPARGLATTLRWRLVNNSDRPRDVSLIAVGSEYLSIEHRETLTIEPGETKEMRAPVEVAARIPDTLLRDWKPAPSVRSIIVIDGVVTELRTGMKPVPPIEMSIHPPLLSLTPGVATRAHVQLRNRLPREVDAAVSLSLPEGLSASWDARHVSIDAGSFAGAEVELTADARGARVLGLSATFETGGRAVQTPVEPQAIIARQPGDITAVRTRDGVRVQNDEVIVTVATVGADVQLFSVPGRRRAGGESGNPVPPEQASEFESHEWDLQIERDEGRIAVVATAASTEHPGFSVVKRVETGAAGIVTITYRFDNDAPLERGFKLVQWVPGFGGLPRHVLPIAGGIVEGQTLDFPGALDEQGRKPERFDEDWCARVSDELTFGVVWSREDTERLGMLNMFQRLSTRTDCPPRSRRTLSPLHILVGTSGWKPVRELWRRLHGIRVASGEQEDEPRPWLRAAPERPIVAFNGETDATIVVEHDTARTLDGEVTITTPDGWEVDTSRVALSGVDYRSPARIPVHLKTTAPVGAARGSIEVRSDEIDETFELPLLRIGDGSAVRVTDEQREGHQVFMIDNGRLMTDVLPSFAATIGSIREGETEYVNSPFPTPATFAWSHDWHGGIGLEPWIQDTKIKLHKETFTGEVLRVESGGITWDGVRMRSDLTEEEDARGLTLEMDVLTVGGSTVLRVVARLINHTKAIRPVTFPLIGHLLPERGSLIGPETTIKPGERTRGAVTGHWAGVENPDTGRCIAMISPAKAGNVILYGTGAGLVHMTFGAEVPAEGSVERVCTVAIADRSDLPALTAIKDL